jgi:Spy/CpxP family protein refolding chaperone
MRTSIHLAAILIVGAVSPLLAQGAGAPGGPPPMGGMGPGGAGRGAPFLLSHTGDLDLTDAQVVKLAAIARRGAVRLRGMRAAMDSAGVRFDGPPARGDSAARREFRGRMRTEATRLRDQFSADQRDAIAVLTPEQQGKAWQMVSRAGMRAGMRMRRGMMRRPPQG